MTKFTVKTVGFIAWAAAVALTIGLVYEFTSGESWVTIGVAGLAILLSAFGLLFSRHSWEERAYPEIAIGIAMWFAGVVCLGFIEFSYWTSNYDSRYERYAQTKIAKEHQNGLGDRAWKSLMTGDMPATPAQLEAMIAAKRLDAGVARSDNCAKVTRNDSRKACQALYELQAQLAAAQQRLALEDRIRIDAPLAKQQLSSNVFAAAELLAKWRGGEERNWAYIIIIWSWLLVTLVRDGGLLVMNPLGRRKKAAQSRNGSMAEHAWKSETAALARSAPSEPVFRVALPADAKALAHVKAQMLAATQPVIPKDSLVVPPPTNGGTPAPKPEEHKPAQAVAQIFDFPKSEVTTGKGKSKSNRKKLANRIARETIGRWLDDTTTQSSEWLTPADKCHQNYVRFCEHNNLPHASQRMFTSTILEKLGIGAGEYKRTRDGVARLPVKTSNPESWQSQKRKVA